MPGHLRMPNGARQIVVLCPGVHRVSRALCAGLQTVCGLPHRAIGDNRIGSGDRTMEVCVCQGVSELYLRAPPIVAFILKT